MGTHSNLSPSKAVRWMACPGSIREEAKYPASESGPSAIDGTHTHTVVEHCVKANLADPRPMVGVKMKDHDGEFVIDQARADRVKVAIDYVQSRLFAVGFDAQIISERRVNPAYLLGRDDLAGTADIQIIGGGILEVIDYKDGVNLVSAKDNLQLELYVLGALAALKLPINGNYPFKLIRMTIIQPKLALKGLNPITTHEVSLETALSWIPKYVTAAAATDAPDAPLVPGEAQCKYCAVKGCSARANQALADSGIVFANLDLATQSAKQDPHSMTDQQLVEIIEAAPLIKTMLEAAETEALARLKAGKSVSGLKLVYGRGSRVWTLPEEETAEKLIRMGVPKSAVYETKLVSPAKAEKLTWEKTSKGETVRKQLSDRQLKTMETEYVTKIAGKLTVAHESDSRPAVVLDAAPMFAAVEVVDTPPWLK